MKKTKIIFTLVLAAIISISSGSFLTVAYSYQNSDLYKGIENYVQENYSDLNENEKEALLNELYNEKKQAEEKETKVQQISPATINTTDNTIDKAYNIFLEKVNYVINIINSFGENTNKDNLEFNVNFLTNHYDSIKNKDEIQLDIIDWYIEEATAAIYAERMPDSQVNRATRATYNYIDALVYAAMYYKNYNSKYPNWDLDCANFVSQCINAGGKPMKGSDPPNTGAAWEVNWFSSGNITDTTKVSPSWRGANAFRYHWQKNATNYRKFTAVNSDSYTYGWTGDPISLLDSSGMAYHTMMIYNYLPSSNDFVLTAHTYNTVTELLSNKASSASSYIIYNMR